ncbi:MAG: hypothetical protein FJY98_04250 [Candidatus Liptonbacteria bacterium]|nr:hypothetical protein [Candidatus Liptonbacteria bacterium]
MQREPFIIALGVLIFAGLVFAIVLRRDPPLPAAAAARAFAAERLNMEEGKVTVISAVWREWPNTCLGLPLEEEMCAEVITPGYEVTLQFEEQEHVYRTNEDGSVIRQER